MADNGMVKGVEFTAREDSREPQKMLVFASFGVPCPLTRLGIGCNTYTDIPKEVIVGWLWQREGSLDWTAYHLTKETIGDLHCQRCGSLFTPTVDDLEELREKTIGFMKTRYAIRI